MSCGPKLIKLGMKRRILQWIPTKANISYLQHCVRHLWSFMLSYELWDSSENFDNLHLKNTWRV